MITFLLSIYTIICVAWTCFAMNRHYYSKHHKDEDLMLCLWCNFFGMPICVSIWFYRYIIKKEVYERRTDRL